MRDRVLRASEGVLRVTNVENSCSTTGDRYVRDLRDESQHTLKSGWVVGHI